MNGIFLIKGLDFTALVNAAAGDHNNLVDLATPYSDSANEGKGFTLWSKDSALNVPRVPDSNTFSLMKGCLWIRKLHSTASTHIPYLYAWDDNSISDATYLKWKRVEADLTGIQAQIDAQTVNIASANAAANAAQITANTASTTANNANNTANGASATATGAAANATTALANAAIADGKAVAAQTTANAATSAAAAAQTTATQALTATNTIAANKFFTSVEFALADGVVADIAHGLGALPKFIRWILINKVAELGYAIGDEIDVTSLSANTADNTRFPLFTFGCDISKVLLCARLNIAPFVLRRDTGAQASIVVANWKAKCYAWV